MTKCNKLWVSDLIGNDFYSWNGKRVLLGFGTGRGKTVFALKYYSKYQLEHGQKVLYLCNRTSLKKQVKGDIIKYGVVGVECVSYQKLANDILKGEEIPEYDHYICDEAHFFLSDSEFNLYTDIVYEYLLNRNNCTVIYMTATYKSIFARITKDLKKNGYPEPISYYLPTDYSYVDKIYWFKGQKGSVKGIVDTILKEHPEDKIIYFCNSTTKMGKFYMEYSPDKGRGQDEMFIEESALKYMNFMCSKFSGSKKNSFIRKHCSEDAIYYDEAAKGFTFDGKVLVTTKVLDNGVDFKDRKIKHIICDVFDIESAIQCLGRKRVIDENDTCIFYIRDYQHNEVNLFLDGIRNNLKSPQLFLEDREKWITEYGKDRSYKDYTIYFDFDLTNEWMINTIRYEKLLSDEKLVSAMKQKETSYRDEILNYLGETVAYKSVDMEEVEAEKQMDSIEIYLKNHVGMRLSKEQQEEFVNLCNLRDRFNRLQKAIGIIQEYIKKEYPYKIESKRFKEKGKQVRHWVISDNDKSDECKNKREHPPP